MSKYGHEKAPGASQRQGRKVFKYYSSLPKKRSESFQRYISKLFTYLAYALLYLTNTFQAGGLSP